MGLPPHFIQDPLGNKKLALKTQLPYGMMRTGGGVIGELDPRNAINLVRNPISFGSDVSDWFPCVLSPYVTLTSSAGLVDELGDTINLLTNQQVFENDDYVNYNTSGTNIGGLISGSNYWIVGATATSFQVSSTKGGAPINLTSDGVGDHVFRRRGAKYNFLLKGTSDTAGLSVTCEKQASTTLSYTTSSSQTNLLQVGDPLTYQAAIVITPTASAYTNKIKLKLLNGGTPWTSGKFVIEIRSVSSGNPTLDVLSTTGELDVTNNNHVQYGSSSFLEYTLSNYVSFVSGTPIAIVIRPLSILSGSSSNIRTVCDLGAGDGNSVAKLSTTGGLSWSNQTYDWHYEIIGDNLDGANDMLSTVGQIKLSKTAVSHTNPAWVMGFSRIPRAWIGKQLIFEFDFYNPNAEVPFVMFYDIDSGKALSIYGLTNKESDVNIGGDVGMPLISGTYTHRVAVNLDVSTRTVAAVIVYPGFLSSSALNFYISNMSYGPQKSVLSVPTTAPKSFSPDVRFGGSAMSVGAGSKSGTYFRMGPFMFLRFYFTLGAGFSVPAGTMSLTLPDGAEHGNNGVPHVASQSPMGQFAIHDSGSNRFAVRAAYSGASNTILFPVFDDYAGSATNPIGANSFVTNTVPMTWASGDEFEGWALIPIKNWDTSNVMSTAELTLRNAGARVEKSGTQAFSVETKVTGWTSIKDTGGLWDSTNNRMVAKSTGWHIIQLQFYATPTTTTQMMAAYKVNGGTTKYVGEFPNPASASDRNGGWTLEYLNAGDYVESYLNTNAAVTVQAGAGTVFGMVNIADLTVIGNNGPFEIRSASSATKTPVASGDWHIHTGNSLTLSPGIWELLPSRAFFSFSPSTAAYSQVSTLWSGSNGTDSTTPPSLDIDSIPGLTVLSGSSGNAQLWTAPANIAVLITGSVTVKVTSTVTVYLNTLASMTTPGNARINVYPQARRVQ